MNESSEYIMASQYRNNLSSQLLDHKCNNQLLHFARAVHLFVCMLLNPIPDVT